MRLPTREEEKRMKKELRERFVQFAYGSSRTWDNLTGEEKKEIDAQCDRYYRMLQF